MAGLKCRKREPEKRRTCDRCGRMGHVSEGACVASERAINMVGIEIEGYWRDTATVGDLCRKMTGAGPKSDGSLTRGIECEDGCGSGAACGVCGAQPMEICTRPGSLGEAVRQLTALYPDATDDAASMHVHVSFRSLASITLLASDAFLAHWAARWNAWGTTHKVATDSAFWRRLAGRNTYCKINEPGSALPGPIVSAHRGDRYHQVNFTAWGGHKTVEFRLLPMFQSCALGVAAVEELVNIVEDFLTDATAEIVADVGTIAALVPDVPPVQMADVSTELAALASHRKDLPSEEIGDLVLPSDASPTAIVVPRCYARERIAELYRDLDLPELVEY